MRNLHSHDLVTTIDIDHLSSNGGCAVARQKNPGRPNSAGSQLRFKGARSW